MKSEIFKGGKRDQNFRILIGSQRKSAEVESMTPLLQLLDKKPLYKYARKPISIFNVEI